MCWFSHTIINSQVFLGQKCYIAQLFHKCEELPHWRLIKQLTKKKQRIMPTHYPANANNS